jgi:multiple sugar transport system substrate-binding protein
VGQAESGGAAGTPAASRTGSLTVSNALSTPEVNAIWARIVQQFRERYPGVRVEEVNAPVGEYNQKLLSLLAQGTPPDVMRLYFDTIGAAGSASDLAARGALLPLDRYVAREPALRWDDLWPAVRAAGQLDRVQMALPANGVNAAVVYFNRDLMGAAGRLPPDELARRGRWTWDTLVDEATHLTRRDEQEGLQVGLGSPLHWEPGTWARILLQSYGADYLDPARTRVVADTAEAVRALRVAQELGPRRRAMPLAGDGNTVDLVRQGRVAEAVLWFAAASWWRPLSFDWDVAPVPAGPAGRPVRAVVSRLGVWRQTREPDLAWAYAIASLSPEVDLDQAVAFGQLPLRRSSLAPWREQMRGRRPANLQLAEAVLEDLRLQPLYRPHPNLGVVEDLLTREVTALLLANKEPQQVVAALASEGNRLLAAAGTT